MNRNASPLLVQRRAFGLRTAIPIVALALLAGCGNLRLGGTPQATVAEPPPPPQDPVAAFAANAQPGSQSRVTLSGGQSANVRMVRSYAAASGRECREVMVGTGNAARPQLVCLAESGGWAPARPLLRGSGRP